MLSNTLFSNPWQSWHLPKQVEDAQTICEANLFDDDMSSISNPGNHSNNAITPTESQMDIVPPAAYAQPGVPSHHGTSEPEYMSTSAGTSKCVQQDIPMNPGTEGSVHVVLLQSSKWLYEKEEALNKLHKQAGQQGWEHDVVAGLQSLLKQREKKERELANIKQCYVWLKKPDNGTKSGSMLAEGHEEETRGKAAPGTLDDEPDPPLVSAMVEAVTKSAEMTLRTIPESGNHFSVGAIP
ncbi:hypothetical protein EDC04DRAFT_2609122 [Pisolithus marmoratus]|nr:hypothetical protein EDC04DRAFT_2609122 [Pisolithus marmoratus]